MRRRKTYLWSGIILAVAGAAAWGFTLWRSDQTVDPVVIAQGKPVSAAVNDMGSRMVADLSAHHPRQNVFISPLSVFMALAMTESGAGSTSRDAMRQALAVPHDLPDDQLMRSASALLKVLQAERGAELSIANALWSDRSQPLSSGFVNRCRKFYQADATTLDFSQPSAAGEIEKWVQGKTHGKISGLVSPDQLLSTRVLLTNAVYFHGKWAYQFPKNETRPESFHLAGGEKKVPMMHQSSVPGAYRSGDGFEAAALDYRESHIRLYAILPSPGSSPEQALAKISMDQLKAPPGHVELDLRMPRFTLDYKEELTNTLSRMGMGAAFRSDADFAPMGSPGFFIGGVVHKTRLEVDEEGTVAAAATAVKMLPSSVPRVKTLVFNRPFALLLCDTQTNAVLFAGVVYKPGP